MILLTKGFGIEIYTHIYINMYIYDLFFCNHKAFISVSSFFYKLISYSAGHVPNQIIRIDTYGKKFDKYKKKFVKQIRNTSSEQ